ncbi:MerR family transcriptional regulator [Caproicibacter sp.]|uniref:MerR family transcriptional regulator n=1 Tax=Caproicibacter sp. TaxID=2814884 RepID=UPI003989F827
MFTIGEFSKLSHISARMLRHYDAIGLLRPAHVNEQNGYRYYDAAQLPVLLQIETLKDYGFSLSEISELLALSREALAKKIHAKRLQAYDELHKLRKTLRRMEDDIINMEGNRMVQEKYHVIVMDTPAQRVFGLRKTISIAEVHDLFQELLREAGRRGLKRAGATQLMYHGKEFSYDSMDAEAQVQVSGDGPDVQEIPGQLCVATTHVGPYETVKYAYDAICDWMAGHPEYQISGPVIERYLKDEHSVSDPDEYETGILFPVTKAE